MNFVLIISTQERQKKATKMEEITDSERKYENVNEKKRFKNDR